MDSTLRKTRQSHFYKPVKSIVPHASRPADPLTPGVVQLFRKTGKVVQHKEAPEPFPPKRYHPGESSDLFVLKGGTANYKDDPSTREVPAKDQAHFYGINKNHYATIGEQTKFGESVMKFYGDGSLLKKRKEIEKETISEAKSKFYDASMPFYKTKTGTLSSTGFGRKTLKQEQSDFNKFTMTYADAYQSIYGNKERRLQTAGANKINLFQRA